MADLAEQRRLRRRIVEVRDRFDGGVYWRVVFEDRDEATAFAEYAEAHGFKAVNLTQDDESRVREWIGTFEEVKRG